MRNWGLDYPNAVRLRPGLIMVSCSGFGHNGPYSQYPGQATTLEATHGLAYVTGYRGGEPSKAGQSFVDFLATWALVSGTMLGLRYKHRFGKGLWVDVGMYQLGCYMLSERVLDWGSTTGLANASATAIRFWRRRGAIAAPGMTNGVPSSRVTTRNGPRSAGRSAGRSWRLTSVLPRMTRAGPTMTRSTRSSARG
jgi:crotonobetainyl-CoA:carnitine CoA-transferase CaiB-like acyl-CoA transferase